MDGILIKFANDTKITGRDNKMVNRIRIQKVLDGLEYWTKLNKKFSRINYKAIWGKGVKNQLIQYRGSMVR